MLCRCGSIRPRFLRLGRIILLAGAMLLTLALPAALAEGPSTVVLDYAGPCTVNPYQSLAEEIAAADGSPLAHTIHQALEQRPEAILWVVAPQCLSEQVLAEWAIALDEHGQAVALGFISGSTEERARALWQRRPAGTEEWVAVVPREGTVETYRGGQLANQAPFSQETVLAALRSADILSYQGHGTATSWHPDDDVFVKAGDIASLAPLVVSAGACQTFKLWREGSIAVAMTDQGALAYLGYLHSPFGYAIGEPKLFPLQYTWPEYPIGYVVQVQARGLTQGHLAWPYWLVVGDPRRSFAEQAPYSVTADTLIDGERVVRLSGLASGVVPVRIEGGAAYGYVHAVGIDRTYRGDPFYDGKLQMADIGANKYLLVDTHQLPAGGELVLRLAERAPLGWPLVDAVIDALDHTTIAQHAEGSVAPAAMIAGVVMVGVIWRLLRRRGQGKSAWRPALLAGLGLMLLRAIYAYARQEDLSWMFDGYLRTIDVTWEVSPAVLASMGIIGTGGSWLFLTARHWWGRALNALLMLMPTALFFPYLLGTMGVLNLAAQQQYGTPIYGYAAGIMAAINLAIEAGIMALLLWLGSRPMGHRPPQGATQ